MSKITKIKKELLKEGLSIQDLDKIIQFIDKIKEKFNSNSIKGHIKIGEDSLGLPEDLFKVQKIIEKEFEIEDLDYISVFFPDKFTLTVDFTNEEMILNYYDDSIKQEIKAIYKQILKEG